MAGRDRFGGILLEPPAEATGQASRDRFGGIVLPQASAPAAAMPAAPPSPAGVADFLGSYEDPGVPQPDMMAWMEDPVNNPPDPSWLPPKGPAGEGVDPNSQNPYDFMQSAYGQQRQGRGVKGAIPAVEGFLGQYGQEPQQLPGMTADGEPLLKYPNTPTEVYDSAKSERTRLQLNKQSPFQYSQEDWDKIGGALLNGQSELPTYDGSVPLATLMKPKANAALGSIREMRALDDDAILEQLYRGTDNDLSENGADAAFRSRIKALNNYRALRDKNPDAKKKYERLASELAPKARKVWQSALDNQERFEQLKQAWREKLDAGEGLYGGLRDSARERVAGQAFNDVGSIAGDAYFTATGQMAKRKDLGLAKMAYDEVINEYAGDSKLEGAARGIGSSLFQGMLFGRLGAGVAGQGEKARQIGATIGNAVAFGAGARAQTEAQASMTPTTEREQRRVAGRQAAIEAGVMGGFALAAGAMGAQTLESILGGGQKIQNIKNTATTILSEMTEESATTALQDWNQKTGGLTPDDAPLMPQMVDTWIQTALTLGLAEGSTRVADFITKPTKEKAAALGLDKVYSDDQLADVASSVASAVYGPSEQGVDLTSLDPPTTGQDQAGADFAKQAWNEINATAPQSPADAAQPDVTQGPELPPEAAQATPQEPALPPQPEPTVQPSSETLAVRPNLEPAPQPKRRLGDKKAAEPVEPSQTLKRTASWVIRDKETGEVQFETFNPAEVERLNKEKYEAVPILDYLTNLNREIAAAGEPPTESGQPADVYQDTPTPQTPAEPAPPTESGQSPATSGQDTPSVAPPDAPPVATSQAPADSGVAREVTDVSRLQESYVQAQKQPDGTYKLAYTGTSNEVFPGERFQSAWEARNYFKATRQKQRDAAASQEAPAPAEPPAPKKKLGQKRTPPPVIKAADLKQKLREVATTPDEGDALYSIVEARAKAAGESVDDYVAKRFADVLKANRSESVYLKQLASGKPDALAQEQKQGPKPNAEIQFLAEDGRAIIRAFTEGQNFSSLLHELLHVFELDLTDVQRASLDNWLGRGDWTYNGAKPGKTKDGKWNRAAREKFARAGERYFREGKAPTPELEGVFAKFKEWLSSVYKTIKGSPIDVELSPDIRSVLDELFGKKKLGDKKTTAKKPPTTKGATDGQVQGRTEGEVTPAVPEQVQEEAAPVREQAPSIDDLRYLNYGERKKVRERVESGDDKALNEAIKENEKRKKSHEDQVKKNEADEVERMQKWRNRAKQDSVNNRYWKELTARSRKLKGKNGEIQATIKLREDPKDTSKVTGVKKEPRKAEILTPELAIAYTQEGDGGKKEYTLTHIPTGLSMSGGTQNNLRQLAQLVIESGIDLKGISDEAKSEAKDRLGKLVKAWDNSTIGDMPDDLAKTIVDSVKVTETQTKADIVLDSADLGAYKVPGTNLKDATAKIKEIAKAAPEFAYEPVFTVNAEKQLVFKDGVTYKLAPSLFNLAPGELTEGQTVGINIEDLGIEPLTAEGVVIQSLKNWGFSGVRSDKKGGVTGSWKDSKVYLTGSGDQWTVTGDETKDSVKNARFALKKIHWLADGKAKAAPAAKAPAKAAVEPEPVDPDVLRVVKKLTDWQASDKIGELLDFRSSYSDYDDQKRQAIIAELARVGAVPLSLPRKKNVTATQIVDHLRTRYASEKYATPPKSAESQGLESPKTINEWIDQPMPAGALGITPGNKIPARKIDDTLKGSAVASSDPDVEKQWQESKWRPTYVRKLDNAIEAVKNVGRSFTRKWIHLDPKEYGATLDMLRRAEEIPTWGRAYAANVLRKITAGLGPNKYDVFSRVLILRDLKRDVANGLYLTKDKNKYNIEDKPLPFGYTPETLKADLAKFEQIAKENPDIAEAIERRQEFMTTLRDELVDRGLLPEQVKEYDAYFHHQVLQYMQGARFAGDGIGKRRLAPPKNSWQKKRSGSELNYNTEYLDAEFAVISQAMAQIKLQDLLKSVRKMNDLGPHLRELAGKDWKKNIPDGYQLWQPVKGSVFYRTMSISDRALQDYLDGVVDLTEEDFREVLVRGQNKEEWVIPDELALTLDDFRPRADGITEAIAAWGMNRWKKWRLVGAPFFLKYNLNNMSGDTDAAMAADPAILKYGWKTQKDLQQFHRGSALTPELSKAIELGVIGSGRLSEISRDAPTLSENQFFASLYGKNESTLRRIWKAPERFTSWREDILRLSAYRRALELLNKGKDITWASRRDAIEQMRKAEEPNEVIAARLARDLIGDYGNVSAAGTWIRSHMIPFWSWLEINSPRYYRLIRNAHREGGDVGKVAGVVGKKVLTKAAGQTAKRALQMTLLYGAMNAWNLLVMGDLEDELSDEEQDELHIVVGRREDGSIVTIRMEGALADALSTFALEDAPRDIAQLASGDATFSQKVIETAKAPINRIVGGVSPIAKTAVEAATGYTLYPDVFDARPIRDPKEHLARLLIPTNVYRKFMDRPTRDGDTGGMLMGLLTRTTDPGEAAYYTARNMASEWQKESGKEASEIRPNEKANALYYHKQAIKYGDKELAERWKARYEALGGKDEGVEMSVERSSPIGFLQSKIDKADFMLSLNPDEMKVFKRANEWYQRTYTKPVRKSDEKADAFKKRQDEWDASIKDPLTPVLTEATEWSAKKSLLGQGLPKKQLGQLASEYDKKMAEWQAERRAATEWLKSHKDSPVVQKVITAARKEIPVKPEPKYSSMGVQTNSKQVKEWNLRYKGAAELVKSLR